MNPSETYPKPSAALPFGEREASLLAAARAGEGAALAELLRGLGPWLHAVALRMVQTREDAEDATQETLLRVARALPGFRGESRLSTWAYRILANHLEDRRRSRAEAAVTGFHCYGDYLDGAARRSLGTEGISAAEMATPDLATPNLATPNLATPEQALLVAEARALCLLGLLLCLGRRERLAFVLGECLDLDDRAGAAVLNLETAHFRKLLSRGREKVSAFLGGRCGLYDPANPCRCAARTRVFVADGLVDPARRVFVPASLARHLRAAKELAPGLTQGLAASQHRLAALYGIPLCRETGRPDEPPADLSRQVLQILAETGVQGPLQSPWDQPDASLR